MLKRLSWVIGLAAALSLAVGCVTTKHTYTTRTVQVKANPAVTQVKVHEPHGGNQKIMVKSNPSGTSLKVKGK